MNLLQKLLTIGKSPNAGVKLKRTPEMQAALARIEARKQQEQIEEAARQRRDRLYKSSEQLAREVTSSANSSTRNSTTRTAANPEEQLRQLRRNGERRHNDKLEADSGITANSRMDVWLNSVMPEDPPDTIAPDLRIPDTVFDIETNSFKK